MNWLFLLVPISFVIGEISSTPPAVLFFVSALAIVPVAHLIAESTEQIALKTGDAVGGLLNASFGNFPELIISLVALRAGKLDLVGASIIGAILANLLLAQGVSFLLGGIKYHDQQYNPSSIRLYSSMMLVAVISLGIPSTFVLARVSGGNVDADINVNIVLSILLLIMYLLYLVYTLVTHPDTLATTETNHEHHAIQKWGSKRAIATLVGASVLAAFLSELLVGSAEGAGHSLGMSQAFIGMICVAVVGGAAESLSAIAMARKNRMDLSIGISLGSSIQIALFVAPLLMLLSLLIAPQPFLLVFSTRQLAFLLLSVLLGAVVAGDGRSNWYKGTQLILLYVMLGVALYMSP